MSTRIFLSNEPSDVSGYLKAIVGSPGRLASSTVSTAVTTTTSSGDNIAMTLTEGGTTAKWITAPMKADVTIAKIVLCKVFAAESAAAANAGIGIRLCEYTTSEQAAFLDFNAGIELGTTIATLVTGANVFSTTAPTSTVIDAGNRLVIAPDAVAVGTMGASQTVTMNFNGTPGSAGETYIELQENLQVTSQVPNFIGGPSVGRYTDILFELDAVAKALFGGSTTVPVQVNWNSLRDELLAQRDRATA